MILLVGDTHGDYPFWYETVIPAAKRHRVATIVQLGDFGYWEHQQNGIKYLHRLNERLAEVLPGVQVMFIDGNHENHTWLRNIYGNHPGQPAPRRVRSSIWWMQRGSCGTLDGMKWLACGGAYSIDKPGRVVGQSWWPEETISDKDVATCRSRGRADVLFSHDCPLGVNPWKGHGQDKIDFPDTQVNRHKLTTVMKDARVKLVVHGHWHEYHDDTTVEGVRVVGLGCNTNHRYEPAMALLDPHDLSVSAVE